MSALTDDDRLETVRMIAERRRHDRGPLLPILHDLMAAFGFIDRADLPIVADVLNVSVAEVHGVVTFYHDFRMSPPAPHRVAVCRGEACQSVGADELRAATSEAGWGSDVEFGEVFCLGNCALGPSATIDGRLHGRLDPARLAELVREVRS